MSVRVERNRYTPAIQQQHLFKVGGTPIDFSVIPAIATDEIAGLNATISGSNYLETLVSNAGFSLNTPSFDANQNFTIFYKIKVGKYNGGNSFQMLGAPANEILFRIARGSSSDVDLYIGGSEVLNYTHTKIEGDEVMLGLRKTGTLFEILEDGVVKASIINTHTFTYVTEYFLLNGVLTVTPWGIFCYGTFQESLNDTECLEIGNSEKVLYDKILLKASRGVFYPISEGYADRVFDIINGNFGNANANPYSVAISETKHVFNLEIGIKRFEEDAGSCVIFQPLSYLGADLNVPITGFTGIVVEQTSNDLLNCETKLDNTAADGLNVFWGTSKTYAEIQAAPPEINFVQGINKINELTT